MIVLVTITLLFSMLVVMVVKYYKLKEKMEILMLIKELNKQ